MPDNLLSPSNGLSKSLLDQITATESDVVSGKTFIGSDGDLKIGTIPDRGLYQYATGFGSGLEETFYPGRKFISCNGIPEGLYRNGGTYWTPEIRVLEDELIAHLQTLGYFNLNGKSGTNGGSDLNNTTYVGCDKGAQWGSIKIRNMTLTINSGNTATVSFDATCSLEPSGQTFPYRRGTFTFTLV